MNARLAGVLLLAPLLVACAGPAYVQPSAGVAVSFTGGGPYVNPYFGVGFGLSGERDSSATWTQAPNPQQKGPLIVTTEQGVEVRIDMARVSVAGAALAPCEEGVAAETMRKLREGHDEAHWLDLLALKEREIAHTTVRPGDYCVVGVKLAPGDGRSLEMEGAWRQQGTEGWTPFMLATGESVTTLVRMDQPLRLGNAEKQTSVHVRFDPARWFDGVDLKAGKDQIASKVLANIAARPGEVLTPPKEHASR